MSDDVEPDDATFAPAGRVGSNALMTVGFRVVSMSVGFATLILTTRLLDPSGRGAYVLASLTVTVAAAALGNLGVAATHAIGKRRADIRVLSRHCLVLGFAVGAAGAMALIPIEFWFTSDRYRASAVFPIALPGLIVAQTFATILLATGRTRVWNVLQMVAGALTAAGMLIFVGLYGGGFAAAAAVWVTAQLSAAGAFLVATRKQWWPAWPLDGLRKAARPLLGLSFRIGGINVIGLLNYRVELLILTAFAGLSEVGTYSLSMALAELLWLFSGAIAIALVAPVVRGDEGNAATLVARGVRQAILVTTVLGVMLAAASIPLIPLVFGSAFRPSIAPLLVLIPGVIAFSPGNTISVYFTMKMGLTRYPLKASALSAIVTVAVAVVAIPAFGAIGAAMAATTGYAIGIAFEMTWFARTASLSRRELLPSISDAADLLALLRRGGRRPTT
jgi:O-antigen/teichoic acid export membrane protein